MKIKLKNKVTQWFLVHAKFSSLIIFIGTFLALKILNPYLNWASIFLYSTLAYIINWLLIDLLRTKLLHYLKEDEAFYLWLEKTKAGAKLDSCFWRRKDAQYYKIFFGNLPTIRIMRLNSQAISLGLSDKNSIEYIACWVTLICKLKGPYSAEDLYQKMIKVETSKEKNRQRYWKINDIYYLRKYIMSRITELLVEEKELLAELKKYKNKQNDGEFIKGLKRLLLKIRPAEILSNCIKIEILKIEPKTNRTNMRLTPLERVDGLNQMIKPRS